MTDTRVGPAPPSEVTPTALYRAHYADLVRMAALMTDHRDRLEWTDPIAGRHGAHHWMSCSENGPEANLWSLDDGSLDIATPVGEFATQATTLVAGLDLSHWSHTEGKPVVIRAMGTTGPPTS